MINIKYKTELCRYWQANNSCPLGARCHFAHGLEEKRSIGDTLPDNAPVLKQPKSAIYQQAMESGFNVNYKTVKCRYWESGGCRFGNKCNFAHGDQELRAPQQNLQSFQAMNTNVQNVQRQLYTQAAQSNPDFQIKHRQLTYLVDRLQLVHPANDKYADTFKMAKTSLETGDIYSAANFLQSIVYDKELDPTMRTKHEEIVNEARTLAANYVSSLGGNAEASQNSNVLDAFGGMSQMGLGGGSNYYNMQGQQQQQQPLPGQGVQNLMDPTNLGGAGFNQPTNMNIQ